MNGWMGVWLSVWVGGWVGVEWMSRLMDVGG